MKIQEINPNDINIDRFENHIIYYFDDLIYGKGKVEINTENVNEAFLFNKDTCVHMYREDGIKAILFTREDKDKILKEKQLGPKKGNVKNIEINKYIEYDKDGQAYISIVLPSDLILRER